MGLGYLGLDQKEKARECFDMIRKQQPNFQFCAECW